MLLYFSTKSLLFYAKGKHEEKEMFGQLSSYTQMDRNSWQVKADETIRLGGGGQVMTTGIHYNHRRIASIEISIDGQRRNYAYHEDQKFLTLPARF